MSVFFDAFIVSFYVSCAGIVSMLGFKALELRSGKRSLISRLADKTNHSVHRYYSTVKTFLSYFNRKSAVLFVEWIAFHLLSWMRAIYMWVYEKAHAHAPSKKVIDMVKGKGAAYRNGGSSLYLKKISTSSDVEVK